MPLSLQEKQMWSNSLVVFHSDNGGEIIFKGRSCAPKSPVPSSMCLMIIRYRNPQKMANVIGSRM